MADLEHIFKQFKANGSYLRGYPYGSGHIHDTFKIETKESDQCDYIVQRLNSSIFKDIAGLQNNVKLVTEHIKSKLIAKGEPDIDRKVLQLISTRESETYYTDNTGRKWRMYIFISNHLSYDIVETEQQAFQGGKAIGRFQAQLSDLESSRLFETIPYFHDINRRLETFFNTVRNDPAGRVNEITDEIKFVEKRAEEMGVILKLGEEGKIPLRTTHNDTKFNNVLLDNDNIALCVIDLDTVMPGYVHYDFGDAIRTAANSSSEDEQDLTMVYLKIELFKSYAEGYLSEISSVLNQTEIEYLAFAPRLITFTIGLRFLTDYIDGDNYFKTHRPGHNLQRARTQFKLVESNEEQFSEMQRIIDEIVSQYKK